MPLNDIQSAQQALATAKQELATAKQELACMPTHNAELIAISPSDEKSIECALLKSIVAINQLKLDQLGLQSENHKLTREIQALREQVCVLMQDREALSANVMAELIDNERLRGMVGEPKTISVQHSWLSRFGF